MHRFLTTLALTLALGLASDPATALGLGKVTALPVLGQPLNLIVDLRLDAGESIDTRCTRAEVSFGDRVLPDAAVRTRLETSAGSGERRLRVTTVLPVDEPVVTLQLHLGCPSSLSRSFTLFAEPPGRGPLAGAAGDDAWVLDRADTAVSPVLAAVPPEASASQPPARAKPRLRSREAAPAATSRGAVAAAPGEAVPEVRPKTRRDATRRPSRGPVLRLDPVEAESLASPSLKMDTSLSPVPEPGASAAAVTSASAPALEPERAQRQQDIERLKAMEATLLKLRADSQATQKTLDDMQLRVRAAEASRYANPLVYLLALLCLLFAAAAIAMWWLRRRDRAAAAWWAAQPAAGAQTATPLADDPTMAGTSEPAVLATQEATPAASPALPVSLRVAEAPASAPASAPAVAAPTPRSQTDGASVEPRRPMSAEELIDLEQQAEFFVVLGQDDAAIDLLMGHVRSTGGVSPLPYLKLLEIYRRRGEREPYDRIRERFNRRFNAYASEWDVDPEQGLSLEGYPEVMHKLQDAWAAPSRSMELLDAALFRRDAGPTFDVPAYRELLFLYSMARDLAEREVGPEGVDLLLPLGDDAPLTFTPVPASSQAAPAMPDEIEPFSLDLDVSTDQPPRLTLDDPDFKRSGR